MRPEGAHVKEFGMETLNAIVPHVGAAPDRMANQLVAVDYECDRSH